MASPTLACYTDVSAQHSLLYMRNTQMILEFQRGNRRVSNMSILHACHLLHLTNMADCCCHLFTAIELHTETSVHRRNFDEVTLQH